MTEIQKLYSKIDKLTTAIKNHREQKADDRCIEDDDRLYESLGDKIKCDRRVGSKFEMAKNCLRFIENRCKEGEWLTYVELEEKIKLCQDIIYTLIKYSDGNITDSHYPNIIKNIHNTLIGFDVKEFDMKYPYTPST